MVIVYMEQSLQHLRIVNFERMRFNRILPILLVFVSSLCFSQSITDGFSYLNDSSLVSFDVHQGNKPALIFAHFKGCPPCVKFEHEFRINQELRSALEERYDLYEINTTDSSATRAVERFSIQTNPTYIVYHNGLVQHKWEGYDGLESFSSQLIRSNSNQNLNMVSVRFQNGQVQNAELLFDAHVLYQAGELDSSKVELVFERCYEDAVASIGTLDSCFKLMIVRRSPIVIFHEEYFKLLIAHQNDLSSRYDSGEFYGTLVWLLEHYYQNGDRTAKEKVLNLCNRLPELEGVYPVTEYGLVTFGQVYPYSSIEFMKVDYLLNYENDRIVKSFVDSMIVNPQVGYDLVELAYSLLNASESAVSEEARLLYALDCLNKYLNEKRGFEAQFLISVVYYRLERFQEALDACNKARDVGIQDGWDVAPVMELERKIKSKL